MPGIFDKEMTLRQLLCSGVLEVMRIRVAGFPVRKEFDVFIDRFWVLNPDGARAQGKDGCLAILEKSDLPKGTYHNARV